MFDDINCLKQFIRSDGWDGEGQVILKSYNDGSVSVALSVTPLQNRQTVVGSFIGHVHERACYDSGAGPHWRSMIDGPADETNE